MFYNVLKTYPETFISLKSEKNNGYFTWKSIHIFYHISPSSSRNEKRLRQKL